MANIKTGIELQDNFSDVLNRIINSVNISISAMEQMQSVMNSPVEMNSVDGARESINMATIGLQEFISAAQQASDTPIEPEFVPPQYSQPEPEEPTASWQNNSAEVFTSSGAERYSQEVRSLNEQLNALNQMQSQIAATAENTNVFPPEAVSDINELQMRMQSVQGRIQEIADNPLNFGTKTANAEFEQLRGQISQALDYQEMMNQAVDEMDVEKANAAYQRLSEIIDNTERNIRDNVDEQGHFNKAISDGCNQASNLKRLLGGAFAAFSGAAIIKKAFSFVEDCTEAFNTQLNAENQLMVVLGNMLDEDYVSQFTIETDADTTAAVDEINAIQNNVDEVVVPVTAESKALQAEFDAITEKASEIQSQGIYGDEAMIAAAAEFATYFSDTDAITSMMDTLADYAMGMTGGGEIDSTAMVDYATNLGKIMSGSYDAMTKKGFEFSDAQKAIIEGTATQEQLVAVLGEDYASMSDEMQAAAVISQIIEESWGGLYETMSNTPEGKIIQMTNAWGDMKEVIGGQLYPYVILFVDAINENWATIESVVSAITTGLEYMLGVLSWLMEGALNFAQVVIDNWSWISPIIYGVAAALAVYAAYLGITKAAEMASAAGKTILILAEYAHAAATGAAVSATTAETAAQMGLNTALLACPLTWIIVLVIALIAVIYGAVAAINHFAGTSLSATGLIVAAFAVLGAHLLNTFVIPVYNDFASLANFFGNVFKNPTAAIEVLFYDMCLKVIGYISNLAHAIETLLNKIPGVTVDITSGLDNFYAGLEQAQQAVKDKSGWVEYVQKKDYIDYSDAARAGYSFGSNLEDNISSMLNPSNLFNTEDIESALGAVEQSGILGDISDDTSAIADNTSTSNEDLKLLREIAERQAINQFTTANLQVDFSSTANINSEMDIDGFINVFEEKLKEAMISAAEGVHV